MIILRKYQEEQKEFSILSEISRLGLKKGTKNYIRKRKRDIVNKLIQNKREFLAKTKKTERKLTNLPREIQKAGNKSLDYSFRTYESNAANKMMTDDTVRLLGKYKNK